VDRNFLFWTLALFFGSSIAFRGIQDATKGEPLLLTIGLEAIVLAVLVGGIVFFVKRSGRG
jgi:hypothetical protein